MNEFFGPLPDLIEAAIVCTLLFVRSVVRVPSALCLLDAYDRRVWCREQGLDYGYGLLNEFCSFAGRVEVVKKGTNVMPSIDDWLCEVPCAKEAASEFAGGVIVL